MLRPYVSIVEHCHNLQPRPYGSLSIVFMGFRIAKVY